MRNGASYPSTRHTIDYTNANNFIISVTSWRLEFLYDDQYVGVSMRNDIMRYVP